MSKLIPFSHGIPKEKTCCFTGHRILGMDPERLKQDILEQIAGAMSLGYTHFICGGAVGFDTLAAETVLYIRAAYKQQITLEIAIPCTNQDEKWSTKQKRLYENIYLLADYKTLVNDEPYFPGCMQKRNEYMVDRSSLVVAYYNGTSGGTKRTVDYAKRQKCNIWFLNK